MLLWDSTKTGEKRYPASGLKRVADRLLKELQAAGQPVLPLKWDGNKRMFLDLAHHNPAPKSGTFITPEIFSEYDRPGFRDWANSFPGRKVAIFHDAIPFRLPHVTWPRSVARHPHYIKMLGTEFGQVLAVSKASEKDLLGYWKWIGLEQLPETTNLQWGADFDGRPRNPAPTPTNAIPQLLQVGILEPRKNQDLTLDACETLWEEDLHFHLHLAGRVNPHFGKPILARIKKLHGQGHPVTWHKSPSEDVLLQLYRDAHLCVFPSIAEGCGLPVLEALWVGRPVLASNLPSITENAGYGGVVQFDLEKPDELANKLRALLQDNGRLGKLTQQIQKATLPTWRDTVEDMVRKIEI